MGWSAMCNCGFPWPCSLTFVAQCMLKAIKKGVSVRPSIDAMRGYFVSAKPYTVLARFFGPLMMFLRCASGLDIIVKLLFLLLVILVIFQHPRCKEWVICERNSFKCS